MQDKGQMIFSNFMSVLFVIIIFISVFFITYSVFKIKSELSGPMTFKSEIAFKNAFENRFLFSRELQSLNVVFERPQDDNITTFETIALINAINSSMGNGFIYYDDLDGPPLKDFPLTRRFFFVYGNKIQEGEKELLNYDYQTSQILPTFPMNVNDFFRNYIQDMYSFKSFEFPIFFRKYVYFIVVIDYMNKDNIVNV